MVGPIFWNLYLGQQRVANKIARILESLWTTVDHQKFARYATEFRALNASARQPGPVVSQRRAYLPRPPRFSSLLSPSSSPPKQNSWPTARATTSVVFVVCFLALNGVPHVLIIPRSRAVPLPRKLLAGSRNFGGEMAPPNLQGLNIVHPEGKVGVYCTTMLFMNIQ